MNMRWRRWKKKVASGEWRVARKAATGGPGEQPRRTGLKTGHYKRKGAKAGDAWRGAQKKKFTRSSSWITSHRSCAKTRERLTHLLTLKDIKGDLQMHSTASDGKNSIEEMAEAARKLGHQYIAITDHSKAVTVANGLDEKRAAAHVKKIHGLSEKQLGIRVLAGAEVDILKDGELDYSDETLAQLDVIVCS